MRTPLSIPAQITDGRAAWREFVSGVAGTFDDNAALLPALGIAAIVVVVIWLDWIAARWLVRSRRGPDDRERS